MKTLAYVIIVLSVVLFVSLYAQTGISYRSADTIYKDTYAVTVNGTTDTTLIAGALTTDKYQLTATSAWTSIRFPWVEAIAGGFVIHCDSTESGETANIIRTR